MDFRLADINDTSVIVDFRKRQLIDEGQTPDHSIDYELENYFSSLIADENSVVWIAMKDDRAVAVGCVYFYQYPPSFKNITGKMAYVHTMYTVNEYRGQGAASYILNSIIDEAKKRNCRVIQLQASEQGKPVYKKIGFIESDGYMIMKL